MLLLGLAFAVLSIAVAQDVAISSDERLVPMTTIGLGSLTNAEVCPVGDCFLISSYGGLYLWSMQGKLLSTLVSGTSVQARWSADGTMIATALGNGSCAILSKGGDVLAKTEGPPSGAVDWLGGDPVVMTLDESKLHIWGLRNATLLREIPLPGDMWGMSLSHDSGLIAAWFAQDPYIYIYSYWNGSLAQKFDAGGILPNARWSPDDTKLAYSPYSTLAGALRVWDVSRSAKVAEVPVQSSALAVEWSPDGSLLAASFLDWIRIYDGTTLDPTVSMGPTGQRELLLSWFPDGSHLLSGSVQGPITIWNLSPTSKSLDLIQERCGLNRVRVSASGLLAIGLDNGTLRCISGPDLDRTEFSAELKGAGAISALGWSCDSSGVATGYVSGMVATWSSKGGLEAAWTAHSGTVRDLGWHPGGDVIATVGDDGFLALWDRKGTEIRRENVTSRMSRRPMSLSFSPNGSMIAVGFAEGTARILSYRDLEVLVSPMRTGRFTCLRWAASEAEPGMDRVAGAGSSDGSVLAWEVWGKLSYYLELKGHSREVTDLSWSPDGSMLATCSLDGDVRLWHMVQRDILGIIRSVGGLLETLPTGNELASVDWAPDGSVIASSKGGALYRWSPSTRQTLWMQNHTSQILDVAWSPDSKEIAFNLGWEDLGIYHLDSGTLDRWSLGVEPFGSIMSIDWSGDGTKVAVGDASSIRILASGGEILSSTPQKGGVKCVEWSPDSGYLASTAMDASIRIWDGYTGNLLATLTGHSTYISALSWSPDGKWLASSDLAGWVILWEMPRGEIVKRFGPVGDRVQWISWSPGANLIAVLGMDTRIGSIALSILDVEGNAVWSTPLAGLVSQVAWSPTGTYLAFSSGRDCVSVLTNTGLFVCNLTPASWGEVVEWSMDGRFVASGGYDGILKIYDAELIAQITEITEAVACLAFLLFLVSAERKTRPATGPNNQPSLGYTWPSARRGAQQSSERFGSTISQDRRAKAGYAASVCYAPFREEGWGFRCTRCTAGTR